MFGAMSLVHWLVFAAVVAVLFGRGKITSVMSDLGGGLREFKKGLSDAVSSTPLPRPEKEEE